MLICTVVVGFLFGNEIYKRKTPFSYTSEELVNNQRVKLSEFPLLMYFSINGVPVNDVSGLFDFYLQAFTITEERKVEYPLSRMTLDKCDPERFTNHKEFVKNVIDQSIGRQYFCLSFDNDTYIQNPFSSYNSTGLTLSIMDCNPENPLRCSSYKSPNGLNVTDPTVQCDPDRTKKNSFIFLSFKYISAFVEPQNYTSPIVYYEDSITEQFSTTASFQMVIRLILENNLIVSDVGWILEEIKQSNFINMQNAKQDIYSRQGVESFRLIMEVSNRRKRYGRTYMKIQDLFAKVGGIINALFLIGNIILHNYVEFKYIVNYSQYIVSKEFRSEDEEGRNKENANLKHSSLQRFIKTNEKDSQQLNNNYIKNKLSTPSNLERHNYVQIDDKHNVNSTSKNINMISQSNVLDEVNRDKLKAKPKVLRKSKFTDTASENNLQITVTENKVTSQCNISNFHSLNEERVSVTVDEIQRLNYCKYFLYNLFGQKIFKNSTVYDFLKSDALLDKFSFKNYCNFVTSSQGLSV